MTKQMAGSDNLATFGGPVSFDLPKSIGGRTEPDPDKIPRN